MCSAPSDCSRIGGLKKISVLSCPWLGLAPLLSLSISLMAAPEAGEWKAISRNRPNMDLVSVAIGSLSLARRQLRAGNDRDRALVARGGTNWGHSSRLVCLFVLRRRACPCGPQIDYAAIMCLPCERFFARRPQDMRCLPGPSPLLDRLFALEVLYGSRGDLRQVARPAGAPNK